MAMGRTVRGRTGSEGIVGSKWAEDMYMVVGSAVAVDIAGGRATRVLLFPGGP